MAEETYKYTYFDLNSRGETPRAMFLMAGQEFEDVRILPEDWYDKLKQTTPLGFLPILETSKGILCETPAINYYVGDKMGFLPEDEFEKAQCNSILLVLNDLSSFVGKNILMSELYKVRPTPDNIEELKAQGREHLIKTTKFIQSLTKESGKFIFGDKMTVADLSCCFVWMLIKPLFPWSEFNNDWLNRFMENMQTDPMFVKYLKERPADLLTRGEL